MASKPALIGASLGGLAGVVAEGKCAPGSFGSLTLVDVTPQMEPSGVARVVGFMAAHARDGFASVEEAAQVIADYLPHRPSRQASARSEEIRVGKVYVGTCISRWSPFY